MPPCFPGVITNTAPPSISPTSGGVPIYVFTSNGNWSPCQASIDRYEYAWYVNGNLASSGASWYSVTSPGVPVWSSVRACSDEYGCSAWANSNVGTYQASCSPGPPWNINAPIISPTSGSVPITVSTNTGGWATCPEAEVTSYNVLWYVNGSAVASNVFSYTVTTPNVGVFSSVQACDNLAAARRG